jgi:4-amino-4-deoxy-L-arabinose transferase-like glycosyltransferase
MMSSLPSAQHSRRNTAIILGIIVLAGIALRIFQFLNNRSLWEDEVFLASSLIRMNFLELATLPLDYQQRAPVGFLWMSRLCVVLFDNQEMPLRLFPLLCGIASTFVFIPVARYFFKSDWSVVAAVFIVALAPPIVYHSVEAKQYGTAFFCTVLTLYLYTQYNRRLDTKALILWGIGGALILWFSFSSLFVLGGMAGAMSLTSLIKKDWKTFYLQLIPFFFWLGSFVIQYVIFISRFPEEEWLVQFWRNRDAFMPFPPKSLNDLLWPLNQIYSLVRYPMGLSWFDLDYMKPYSEVMRVLARFPFLPIVFGLAGLYWMFIRQKRTLLILSLPVLLALAASSLELYPLRERLTIFLAPIFILVVGMGIEMMESLKVRAALRNILIIFLLAAPLMNSVMQMLDTDTFGSYKNSNQREAMAYLSSRYKPGDVVYVYWNDLPAYLYYQEAYEYKFKTVYGSDERKNASDFGTYLQKVSVDVSKVKGNNRLWYVFRPYNGLKIGDIENEPRWYYQGVNAAEKVLEDVKKLGKVESMYPSEKQFADVKICLITL